MIIKKLAILFLACSCNYTLLAKNSNINELEKRVTYLEKQVADLKKNSIYNTLKTKWENLRIGENKINIINELGNPDRIGKYSNGDEIWGFKNFTLKFDKNGKLQNWSEPFSK